MSPGASVAATILAFEGPGTVTLDDGAGPVSWGQSQAWLDQFSLTRPTTTAEASANIQDWLVLTGLQQIVNASLPLGTAVADWAFNSGFRVALMALQKILGVTPDGLLGSVTLSAVGKVDGPATARQVAKARLEFLGSAITHGQIAPQYAGGLINRAASFL
jgi:lysozyme family protein